MGNAAHPGSGHRHWTDSPQRGSAAPRRLLIGFYSLLIIASLATAIWFILRTPTTPKTFVASIVIEDYQATSLLDVPFGQSSAAAIHADLDGRGLTNWEAVSVPASADTASAGRDVRRRAEALRLQIQRGLDPDPEQDVAIVYIRCHSFAYRVQGPGEASPRWVPVLLTTRLPRTEHAAPATVDPASGTLANGGGDGEGNNSGDGGGIAQQLPEGVEPVEGLLDEIARMPAAHKIVVFDTSDLDSAPSQGIVANPFPRALAETLSRRDAGEPLWVITSGAALQPQHISWRRNRTLLADALAHFDWKIAEGADQISLRQLYTHLVQFCFTATDGEGAFGRHVQTPLLFRSGHGWVAPEALNTSANVMVATVTVPPAPEEPPTNATAAANGNQRLGVRAVVFQSTGAAAGDAPAQPPANAGDSSSDNGNSGAADSPSGDDRAAGAPSGAEPPATPPSPREQLRQRVQELAGENVRYRAWATRDAIQRRQLVQDWSPVDYAPRYWRQTNIELAALDRRHRTLTTNVGTTTEGTAAPTSQDLQWIAAGMEVISGIAQSEPAPTRDVRPIFEILEQRREFFDSRAQSPWYQLRAAWQLGPAWDAQQRHSLDVARRAVHAYADATAQLADWCSLAAHLDSLGEPYRALCGTLDRYHSTFHSGVLDQEKQLALLESLTREIQSRQEELASRLSDAVARLAADTEIDWLDEYEADILLASPLVSLEDRQRIERWWASTAISDPTQNIDRRTSAEEILIQSASHPHNPAGWSGRQELARNLTALGDLLRGIVASEGDVASRPLPLAHGIDDFNDVDGFRAAFAEELARLAGVECNAFQGWFLASVLPELRSPEEGLLAGIVARPVIRQKVRVQRLGPATISLAKQGEFAPLAVRVQVVRGLQDAREFRLRLDPAAAGATSEPLAQTTLMVNDEPVDPARLASDDGIPVRIDAAGEFRMAMAMTTADGATARPLRFQVGKGGFADPELVDGFDLELVPPKPDHIDLLVTFGENREVCWRIGDPYPGSTVRAPDRHDASDALRFIPLENDGAMAGLPYRFWLLDRLGQPRKVRVTLYPIDRPGDTELAPGSVLDSASDRLSENLRRYMLAQIRDRRTLPVATANLTVPASSGEASTGAEVLDEALPIAWTPTATPGADPAAAALPPLVDSRDGLLCVVQELDAEDRPVGQPWCKWIGVLPHPLDPLLPVANRDLVQRMYPPLIEEPAIRYAASRRQFEITVRPYGDGRGMNYYALESLPVTITARAIGEETSEDPSRTLLFTPDARGSQTVTLPATALGDAVSAGRVRFFVSVASAPRVFSLDLPRLGQQDVAAQRTRDPIAEVRIESLELMDAAGQIRTSDAMRRGIRTVILHRRLAPPEGGAPTLVEYRSLQVRLRSDAHLGLSQLAPTQFTLDVVRQRPGYPSTSLGGDLPLEHPRDVASECSIETDGTLVVRGHQREWTVRAPLDATALPEGEHRIFAQMTTPIGSVTSAPIVLIADRTPPRMPPVEVEGDRRQVYEGETIGLLWSGDDELTDIAPESVRFTVPYEEGSTPQGFLEGTVTRQGGKWYLRVDAKAFAAHRPGAEYLIGVEAADIAGNTARSTDTTAASLRWMGIKRPAPRTTSGGTATTQPKTHKIMVRFRLFGAREVRGTEQIQNVTLKIEGADGAKQTRQADGVLVEVPPGTYAIEASMKSSTTSAVWKGTGTLSAPGGAVTIDLQ